MRVRTDAIESVIRGNADRLYSKSAPTPRHLRKGQIRQMLELLGFPGVMFDRHFEYQSRRRPGRQQDHYNQYAMTETVIEELKKWHKVFDKKARALDTLYRRRSRSMHAGQRQTADYLLKLVGMIIRNEQRRINRAEEARVDARRAEAKKKRAAQLKKKLAQRRAQARASRAAAARMAQTAVRAVQQAPRRRSTPPFNIEVGSQLRPASRAPKIVEIRPAVAFKTGTVPVEGKKAPSWFGGMFSKTGRSAEDLLKTRPDGAAEIVGSRSAARMDASTAPAAPEDIITEEAVITEGGPRPTIIGKRAADKKRNTGLLIGGGILALLGFLATRRR